jgi:hypothetical protein
MFGDAAEGSISMSVVKYSKLGEHTTPVPLAAILYRPRSEPASNDVELPTFYHPDGKEKYDLVRGTTGTTHSWKEETVQLVANKALLNKTVGRGFYVHDVHQNRTFLGDLLPDYMVTTEPNLAVLGEPQVAFMIDLKAHSVNPWSDKCIGQATAYAVRLLEMSNDLFRPHAIVVVTNLVNAVVVKVSRKSTAGMFNFSSQYAPVTAEQALKAVFNSSVEVLGLIGIGRVVVSDRTFILSRYLGYGSTSVVYSTTDDFVVKFYTDMNNSETLQQEREALCELQRLIPTDANFRLQTVVADYCEKDSRSFPFLVLSPLGIVCSPRTSPVAFVLSSFLKCLKALKFSHESGILHNDIRPENIIRLHDGELMLIDFAVAWICKDMKRSDTDKSFRSEYQGCVSFAAPSILRDLNEAMSVSDSSSILKLPTVSASELTDCCIALLRTAYAFAFKVSVPSSKSLKRRRRSLEFVEIIDRWNEHLSPVYKQFEANLADIFATDGDMYSAMETFLSNQLPGKL